MPRPIRKKCIKRDVQHRENAKLKVHIVFEYSGGGGLQMYDTVRKSGMQYQAHCDYEDESYNGHMIWRKTLEDIDKSLCDGASQGVLIHPPADTFQHPNLRGTDGPDRFGKKGL